MKFFERFIVRISFLARSNAFALAIALGALLLVVGVLIFVLAVLFRLVGSGGVSFRWELFQLISFWILLVDGCLALITMYFMQILDKYDPDSTIEFFLRGTLEWSGLGPGLLAALSSVLLVFGYDSAAALASAVGFLIGLHCFVTQYRVKKGWFGTNEQEAVELINFMVKHTDESGRPPGSRLSKVHVASAENKAASTTEASGVAQ